MAFDYKKEYKDIYSPSTNPTIITIPSMNYLAIRGKGNPNEEHSEYKKTLELLYTIAYTIKMSYKTDYKIEGVFEYVVPPLEGFWWQNGRSDIDYNHKDEFNFISVIRLPNFVSKKDFDWAVKEATKKKKIDFSKMEFMTYDEGLCIQCMHLGAYDDEPETIKKMNEYMIANGYELDISNSRMHHEVYLSDPRKSEVSKWKTIIRHPIRKISN